jgi:integrase
MPGANASSGRWSVKSPSSSHSSASSGKATPYLTRHTFVSCCLQAGISLATIASWCGTSIQMISRTYGRMIRR